MASAAGWKVPLAQMDMPTDTLKPGSTTSTATPIPQGTSIPVVNATEAIAAESHYDLHIHRIYSPSHRYGRWGLLDEWNGEHGNYHHWNT